MNATPKDAKAIFVELIANVAPGEWDTRLERLCDGDTALHRRVSSLLCAHARTGSFLSDPAAASDFTIDYEAESPGTVVGPYKLLEQIGEGGMGMVYMAEQAHPIRRRVALKVIKPGMDSRQVIARFEAERQALALMDHPNIARVHDAGATGSGRPYFVMELVRGLPITEYCDRESLPIRDRLELFVLVCRAVQHAHQKGVIHRDLKPSNVLVTVVDGVPVPKVIDFGVAKATGGGLTERTLVTGFHQLVGTPLYMSPEQADLSSADVDTRSDIYSLGVLLYELLTGSTPFEGETLRKAAFDEMRRIIREEEPQKPSTRLSGLGETLSTASARRGSDARRLERAVRGELDWITMRALEKDRRRRYETANDFAADVMRYLTDQPVEACPPSAPYRFHKFARRNKAALTTAALVVAALFIGAVVSTWQAVRATQAEDFADRQRKRAEGSASEAQRQTIEARKSQGAVARNLYHADMRLGLVDWTAGNIGRLSSKLFSHVPHVDGEDQRDWEWYYLLALCHQDERTLMEHDRQVNSIGWSPDGRRLASTGSDGVVAVYDATTGQILRMWQDAYVLGGHWSPDSRRVAWTTRYPDDRLCVVQVETGEQMTLQGNTGSGSAPAWSPDGKHLATRGSSGIRLWDPATGSSIGVLDGVGANIGPMAWDQAGKLLVLTRDGQELKTWDAVTGEESRAVPSMTGMISGAWSPDGKQLALGMRTGKCLVYKTADWSVVGEWVAHIGPVNSVVWHPGGSQFASAGADHLIQVWDPATGHNLLTLRGHLNQVISLAWEPNGRRLASAGMDGLVKVWPLPPAPQPRRLEGHAGGVRAMAWCEDGETLRSLGAVDGTIALWNVVNGQPLSKVPVPGVASAQFSPWGRLLAIASTDEKQLEIPIRDARSGELVQTVKHATVSATFSAFSPDASKLALSNGHAVEILDLRQDEVQARWEIRQSHALSWSSDGRFLAAAGNGDSVDDGSQGFGAWVHVFDTEMRRRVVKMQHGASWVPATTLTWSPDGQRLVSGDLNGLVEVWEVLTGHKVASAHLHTAAVKALAWSPNGRRVASGSADGTVRVWDPIRGEELLKLDAPKSDVTHLEWSPNGRRLAGATADGAILIWDATAGYEFVHGEAYAFERVHHSLNQATQLWQVGRRYEARALYEQTLKENQPRVGSFPRWVGMSLRYWAGTARGPGQDQETIELYQLLARINKHDAGSHNDIGMAFLHKGQWDESIASFREVIRLTKNRAAGYSNLGNALYAKGQLDEAIASYREAIRIQNDFATAHNNLGGALYAKGQLDEAIASYREAIRLQNDFVAAHGNLVLPSDYAAAHGNLGEALLAKGQLDEAIASLREAIRISSYGEAQQNLHKALLAKVELAKKAVQLAPSEYRMWSALGVCLYRAGDWKAAVEALEKSGKLRSAGDSFDWFFLAMAHWKLAQREKARTWYDRAVQWMDKNKPQDAELRRFRAEAEELLGINAKQDQRDILGSPLTPQP